ncbi:NUDIX hydrolase [Friedmanniella luteola]|uniref:NUDIX hydrolase n=1 Tax=Friedmanniella luteola TaxID=546871 RepID=UPI001E4BC29E|nr:NUDIX domain-containing protein [Friedmanniella luteola]
MVGLTDDGGDSASTVFVHPLAHGADPTVVAHDAGWAVVRPLSADRGPDGEIVLTLRVRALDGEPRPPDPGRGRDAGLQLPPDAELEVRQRVAAYAVVLSDRGLLATEYSDRTAVPGRWGMPGGGIDADEQPADAVLREVGEETDQSVVLDDLVSVQTSHWVGRSPRGTLEDFQAVRLVYRATCPEPREPRVLDVGGTTESARWVPLATWPQVPWTHNWEQLLGELLR